MKNSIRFGHVTTSWRYIGGLPEMADDFVVEQDILFARACADIVDNQRGITLFAVGYDADMRQPAARQPPGNDVASAVSVLHRPAVPCEINLQIRHAAVVDIRIGAFQPPAVRVGGKIRFHVLVNQLLQVYALLPQCANHYIGAHTFCYRHIAHRIIQRSIGGVVAHGLADLAAGGADDGRRLIRVADLFRCGRQRGGILRRAGGVRKISGRKGNGNQEGSETNAAEQTHISTP